MPDRRPASADRQISAAGRSFTLRYSMRAYVALQDHYQAESFDEVARRISDTARLGARDVVAIFWAGLRTHHPELSQEDALGILDEMGMEGMQKEILAAFSASTTEGAGDPDRPLPRKPSIASSKTAPPSA
jgi:hypothetical protein